MRYFKNRSIALDNFQVLMNRVRGRVGKGVFWVLIATLGDRGSNVLVGVVIARMLGKVLFGYFSIFQSTINMFAVFGALGLGVTATKYVAELKYKNKEKAGRVIGFCNILASLLGILLAIVIYIIGPYFSKVVLSAPGLANEFQVGALLLLFVSLQGSLKGTLLGLESFRSIAIISTIFGGVLLLSILSGTYYMGLTGAIWGWLFASFVQIIMLAFSLMISCRHNKIKIFVKFSSEEFRLFRKFSLPATLSALLNAPVVWAGNAMLVNSPSGYLEMGLYSAAYQWFAAILFLPGIFSNVLFPMLAEKKGGGDLEGLRNTFWLGMKYSIIILGLFSLLLVFVSPYIMGIYGTSFKEGWQALSLLSVAGLLAGTQGLVGNMLAVMDRMWLRLKISAVWAIIFVLLSFFLVKFGWGASGLALATLISYAIRFFWSLLIVGKYLNIGCRQSL